ncbi:hypothetical protein CONLIGDRAFT_4864 [Coniochaeta ligniaria NRRL 30616]|uniref:Uncharacterized protein n=1 Tax=Coniochaeta ligniaria NRRL 30616 TaxID=1408157 RepID=A0A1J7K2P7_9PEZI|nr:hypothetical protein CONLIGDRAFT_4864 [Coniochaeta ligniaria NRRL 30616]
MGALYDIAVTAIVFASNAIMACTMVVVADNGVGPVLEAPAHLNILARTAYYTFHRRFRDFFVPFLIAALVNQGLNILRGYPWTSITRRDCLLLAGFVWLFSLGMVRWEASKYRNLPWTDEEERLWTEGMTRSEFLRRTCE